MPTATFIRRVEDGWKGSAKLYKLSTPVTYHEWDDKNNQVDKQTDFVVVSAVDAMLSGPETYIFPADSDGNCLNWGELHGSYRGGFSHTKALTNAGYEVK